jgi:pilus assembly protein Flp/PilA
MQSWKPPRARRREGYAEGLGSPGQLENAMKRIFSNLLSDDRGGEVLEYALIIGLIVVACIAVIGSIGGKVLARWNSVDSSI